MKNLKKSNLFILSWILIFITYFYLKYESFIPLIIVFIFCLLNRKKEFFIILVLFLCIFFHNYNRLKFSSNYEDKELRKTFEVLQEISSSSYKCKNKDFYFILYSNKNLTPHTIYKATLSFNRLDFPANFLTFNYNNYLYSQRIFLKAYASNIEYKKDSFSLKNKLFNFAQKKIDINSISAKFFFSLFFNHRESKKFLYPFFQNLNISHFLAFSGMHLSFFLFIPGFFSKNKNLLIISVEFLIVVFALILSAFSPSMLRAASIYLFSVISIFLEREPYIEDTLGLFGIFFILINPFIIFSMSFFLSFFFFSLLIFCNSLLKTTYIFFLSNIVLFGSVSIFYPFINFILLFAFPLLLGISITGFIFNILGIPAFVNNFIIEGFINILSLLNKVNISFEASFLLRGVAFSMLIFFLFKSKKVFFISLTAVSCILIYFFFFPYMLIFDTGHGSALFLNTPSVSLLFDSGNTRYNAENTLYNFFNFFNLKINYNLISHYHFDHYGSTPYLDEKNLIKNIFLPEKNTPFVINNSDKRIIESNLFYLIAPFIKVKSIRTGFENLNENSFAYFIKIANKNIGIFSDQSVYSSKKLGEYLPEKLDYFIVGHHGGKNSLNNYFINKYKNALYIISCSSRFSNPHKKTKAFLENRNKHITRYDGALFVDLITGFKLKVSK
ncbi:MAG: ComEC/Rec2 family competence protein [Candidatus Muiribacteriota bacterium]